MIMVLRKIGAIIIFAFSLHANASLFEFEIEENGLSPIPKIAESAITQDKSFIDFEGCKLAGKIIKLANSEKTPSYIATTVDGCGWAAASGPIWVVLTTQGKATLALFENGYSVKVGKNAKENYKNITISTGTAGWYYESQWQFKKNRYFKIKQHNGPAR